MPFSIHPDGLDQSLIDAYDGFILDQFGVLHNGQFALPGAAETIQTLKANGKQLIILSNTSSLAREALDKLPSIGFDPTDFTGGAVTSGQEASAYIKQHYKNQRCILLTWKDQEEKLNRFLDACGSLQVVDSTDEADFILLHGCQVWQKSNGEQVDLCDYMNTGKADESNTVLYPLLQDCHKHNLPMICVNPDYTMIRPDGSQAYMPGGIAKEYERISDENNNVTSFGKPHVPHFQACIKGLKCKKVVHVGDSLHHDIKGANDAGIDSILVLGGVHCKELLYANGDKLPSREVLQAFFDKHDGITPTHVVPMLQLARGTSDQ